jgi:hypothetical protein
MLRQLRLTQTRRRADRFLRWHQTFIHHALHAGIVGTSERERVVRLRQRVAQRGQLKAGDRDQRGATLDALSELNVHLLDATREWGADTHYPTLIDDDSPLHWLAKPLRRLDCLGHAQILPRSSLRRGALSIWNSG